MSASHSANDQHLNLPVASSQNLGWESLVVKEYQQPSGGMKFQAEVDPVVVLILTTKPHRTHETMGENHHVGMYYQSDLCITPASIPSSYFAEDRHHYLYVQISASFLQKIAEENFKLNRDRVEMIPVFQVRDPQLEKLLRLLQIEMHQGGRMGQLYFESLANALVINLLQDYSTTSLHIVQFKGGLGDRKLLQVIRYIDDTLDQDIKLADLAQLVEMSQSHFSRLFKQSMGLSPYQYLLQQRVERAKQLLKKTNQSLVEIALACGFVSQSHFTRQFRQATGVTPKAYRTN
ncbi:AraC family transcriptional regulator [Myxosarcina sp. GI1(2024)]